MDKVEKLNLVLEDHLHKEIITEDLVNDILTIFETRPKVEEVKISPELTAYLEEHMDSDNVHFFYGKNTHQHARKFFNRNNFDFNSNLTVFYYTSIEQGNMFFDRSQELYVNAEAIITRKSADVQVYYFSNMSRPPKISKLGMKYVLKIYLGNRIIGFELEHTSKEFKNADFILHTLYKNK